MSREQRRHRDAQDGGQADRDRILYSPEFRRLAAVTQVAVAEGGLLFHNRLTHSLKVAQIARRLATALSGNYPDLAKAHGGIDPDVVESAALAHDLGHPPFGHVAERRLDRLLSAKSMDGFEGNAQSFRIVTKIAVHRKEHDGLNLTRATLNAILKYPWHRQTEGKEFRKWGAYHSEEEDFNFAREEHKGGAKSPTLEAQIMTWADDITYSVHDIEDFYQAGLIPLDRLSASLESGRFLEGVFERWSREGITSRYRTQDLRGAFEKLFRVTPIPGPYTGERRQQAALRSFSQGLIENYVTNTRLHELGHSEGALAIAENVRMEVEILKELLWFYVIKNPALATQEYGQGQVIEKLFTILAEAVLSNDRDRWNILPGRAKELMREIHDKQGGNAPEGVKLRVAADTIAGMTEQQALLMFHRLTAISPGSLFQPIVV